MLSYETIKGRIKEKLSPHRYQHTLGVIKASIDLSKRYQADQEKAKIAALTHDCAKMKSGEELLKIARENHIEIDQVTQIQPSLLHGPVGSLMVKKDFEIYDSNILNAIEYHTIGRANMSTLEKIIYLADYIEEGRSFPGVEKLRKLARENLDDALLLAFNNSIQYIIQQEKLIHPNTIQARNDILQGLFKNREEFNVEQI